MRMERVMLNNRLTPSWSAGATWIQRAALVAFAIAIPATDSMAAAPCGPRKDLVAQLVKRYSEAPVAVGIANNGSLVEVLTTADGSTWTILITRADGMSCLVAAGELWHKLETVAADEHGV